MANGWSTTYNTGHYTITGPYNDIATWSSGANTTIIGVNGHSSGKYYFEVLRPNPGVYGATFVGLAASTHSNSAQIGASTDSLSMDDNSGGLRWWYNNSTTSTGTTRETNGHWLGYAVDLTNGYIWVKDITGGGSWYGNNGTGDPVAQTNPYNWAASGFGGTTVYLAFTDNNDGAGSVQVNTANFNGTPPSGYSSWETITQGDNWSTSFATSKFTIASNALTANATDINHTDTIIGVTSHTTGKYYFEMAAGSSGADLAWGLTVSGQSNASQLWNGDGTHKGAALRNFSGGTWNIAGTQTGSGGTTPNNETIGFAFDLTGSKAYWRRTSSPTSWFGNGSGADPVAGTGGIDISAITGQALYLAFTSNQNGATETATMNAGDQTFAATAPTGYTAWGVSGVYAASVSESASAATTQSETFRANPTVTESMSAADHPGRVFNLIVPETLHAQDHPNRSLVFTASASDTMALRDYDYPNIRDTITDTLAAADHFNVGVNAHWYPSIAETAHASDSEVVGFRRRMFEVLDPITRATAHMNGIFNMAVENHLHPVTIAQSNIKTNSLVRDTLAATAYQSAYLVTSGSTPGVYNLNMLESGNAVDTLTDPLTFTNPGIYFWGYRWAYDAGIKKLSVWCAGLDCGDWPVTEQGYVFVPWLSDPDGLFQPGYLMAMSNNKIGTDFSTATAADVASAYGATACNIDLTDNTGTIIRIVVDLAIGLCYTSELQVLRPNAQDQNKSPFGPSLAETRRLHMYGVQLVNAQSLSVGTDDGNIRPIVFRYPNGGKYLSSELKTGVHWDVLDDEYDFDGMLMMQMFRPYPATIASVISFFKTFDRE